MNKKKIAFAVCLLLIPISFLTVSCTNRNKIQYTDIEKIYIGMPLDSVVSVLGRPYAFNSDLGCHDLTCKHPRFVSDIKMTNETDIVHVIDSIYRDTNYCCEANKESVRKNGKNTTLTYTKRPCFIMRILHSYPMLWVHLDSVYRVSNVYARMAYFGRDDKCIYSLSSSTCLSQEASQDKRIERIVDTVLFRGSFPVKR